jgi:DNA repair exonuclease SbcCD ATPase subunit
MPADHSNCIDLLHHRNLVDDYNRRLDCAHDGFVSIASHEAGLAQLQEHVHRLQAEAAEASAALPRTELPDPTHPGLCLDDQSVYIASLQQIVQEQRGRMDREASSNSDLLRDAERQQRLLKHQCAESADDLELHQKRHQTTLLRTAAEARDSQRDFDDQLAALQSQLNVLRQQNQILSERNHELQSACAPLAELESAVLECESQLDAEKAAHENEFATGLAETDREKEAAQRYFEEAPRSGTRDPLRGGCGHPSGGTSRGALCTIPVIA